MMTTKTQSPRSLALASLLTLALGAAPLVADEAPAFAPPPEADTAQVDDAQLDQAVDAYVELNAIQDDLSRELAGETDQTVIQERVEAASPDMEAAIADAGLDTATYQRLIEIISGDADLRARFLAKVEAAQPHDATAPPQPQQQPAAGRTAPIDDADLAKAAAAYQTINTINQNLQQELEGETDGDVIQQQVAAAETAMQQAVFDAGLEIQDYNTIMQAVQQDAELQQQFVQILNR